MTRRRVKGATTLRNKRTKVYDKAKLGAVATVCLGVAYMLSLVLTGQSADRAAVATALQQHTALAVAEALHHPNLRVTQDRESESYNAIAYDIIHTLDCHTFLNQTYKDADQYDEEASESNSSEVDDGIETSPDQQRQRRLLYSDQDTAALDQDEEDDDRKPLDDDGFRDGDKNGRDDAITGEHLFCLAAFSAADPEIERLKSKIHCDATHSRQQALLDLWSAARAEMSEDLLKTTLKVATETKRDLVGTQLHLWAPTQDDGLEYVLAELNKKADDGGIQGLTKNLGTNKLFVDVGSCLGLTSMAAALLYPGTKIVSIEAAQPNWLLQEMTWRCNDFTARDSIQVLLAGVGPNRLTATPQMAKFMWRPHATTSTRAWTPATERQKGDVELTVKLRPWHALLTEANIPAAHRIDVLNVDCEGCEYNLIPSLSDADFDSISTVMGGVHWGYIPEHKKPSSKRAKETHQRLCRHENFARTAKECCGFLDLPVISSTPGEILVQEGQQGFPPKAGTVTDVAGELCNDFDEWAAVNKLYDIESDWGWFQISSMAD